MEIRELSVWNNLAITILNEFDKKNRGDIYWKRRFKCGSIFVWVENEIPVACLGVIRRANGSLGLSVWYVREERRKYAIRFLKLVLKELGSKRIVNSSPNPTALKVFKRFCGFQHTIEYLGLPKKMIGSLLPESDCVYFGNRFSVCWGPRVGLLTLVGLMIVHRRIFLYISPNEQDLLVLKNINVLHNSKYDKFPSCVEGDIFE